MLFTRSLYQIQLEDRYCFTAAISLVESLIEIHICEKNSGLWKKKIQYEHISLKQNIFGRAIGSHVKIPAV